MQERCERGETQRGLVQIKMIDLLACHDARTGRNMEIEC